MIQTSPSRAGKTRKRTRIQSENEGRILDAALALFARYGFRGTTLDQIAAESGMSKPNLLYYFRRKQDIYAAVLGRTLEAWLNPLEAMDRNGDPRTELMGYIRRKMAFSRTNPDESRLFATEILAGAPVLKPALENQLKQLFDRKVAVIRHWIDQDRMTDVDPQHLIFMIWATTQHYADFTAQINVLADQVDDQQALFDGALATIEKVLFEGLGGK